MAFTAYIYKDSAWRRLPFVAGRPPVVTKRFDESGMFSFRSPVANMTIFAESEARFFPGGAWEISRGDLIEIYSYDNLIFAGSVDREITVDYAEGMMTFSALGWISAINRILAGRPTFDGARYRYESVSHIEPDDEEPYDVQYIVGADTFETTWENEPAQRLGYKKTYLFDTLAMYYDTVFLNEDQRRDLYFNPLAGEYPNPFDPGFNYSRKTTRGTIFKVPFSALFAEIVRQIEEETGGGFSSGLYDPGTVSSDTTTSITLLDELVNNVRFFTRDVDGETVNYVLAMFRKNNAPYEYNVVRLYEITNQFQLVQRYEWTFSRAGMPYGASFANYSYHEDLKRLGATDGDLRFNDVGVIYDQDNDYLNVYQIWSHILIVQDNDNGQLYSAYNLSAARVYRVNMATGQDLTDTLETDGVKSSFGAFVGANTPLPINDVYDRLPAIYKGVEFLLDIVSDEYLLITLLREQPEHILSITSDAGTYSLTGALLTYAGDPQITNVGFEVRDQALSKFLLDIAILTDSIFWIGDDKTINIVQRDYNTGVTHDISGATIRKTASIVDYYGDEIPSINSSFIENDNYYEILRDYYEAELAGKYDMWEVEILHDATSAAFNLFDKVTFTDPQLGAVEPAIWRITYGADALMLTVARKR